METKKPNKSPCPKCGNSLRLAGLPAGEVVHCPKCGAAITVGGGAKKAAGNSSKAKPTARPRTEKAKPLSSLDLEDAFVSEPAVEEPRHIEGPGPATVVPVNPFVDRAPGELPIAAPATPPGDDDAYEPEIPLIPTSIPEQVYLDANLGSFQEQRRDVTTNIYDDVDVDLPSGPGTDTSQQYFESARRRGLVRHYITPDPPRWTFFSGVFGYPWRGANLVRWIMMSLGLGVSIMLSFAALIALGLLGGELSQQSLVGILFAILGTGLDVVVLALVAASCQAALQDTADGHDLAQEESMPELGQWVFIALSWLMLGTAAAATGFPLSLAIGPLAFVLAFWLVFPILLLGSMETESIVMPISIPVLRSLGYYFGGWIMFYLITTLLAAAAGAAVYYVFPFSPELVFLLSGPVLAALLLIYVRLLGRLAWKASGAPIAEIELDSPPEDGEPSGEQKGAGKKKKRSRVRIVVPDENVPREPQGQAPPKINFHHPR